MKQTAVQWLLDELEIIENTYHSDSTDYIDMRKNSIELAKLMEKEQHKKTWFDSTLQFANESEMLYKKDFEQYYNETFNK